MLIGGDDELTSALVTAGTFSWLLEVAIGDGKLAGELAAAVWFEEERLAVFRPSFLVEEPCDSLTANTASAAACEASAEARAASCDAAAALVEAMRAFSAASVAFCAARDASPVEIIGVDEVVGCGVDTATSAWGC